MSLKFYKCPTCNDVVIDGGECDNELSCHGVPMEELKADSVEAALEKHVPDVLVEGSVVKVQVGSVMHPMIPEHYITLIVLETKKGYQVVHLAPEDEPSAAFAIAPGDAPVAVYEFCSLHGLWKYDF